MKAIVKSWNKFFLSEQILLWVEWIFGGGNGTKLGRKTKTQRSFFKPRCALMFVLNFRGYRNILIVSYCLFLHWHTSNKDDLKALKTAVKNGKDRIKRMQSSKINSVFIQSNHL